jgi:integrase
MIEKRKAADGKISYRVKIRLKGCPPQTATFERKYDAQQWEAQTTTAIKENRYFKQIESKKHTFAELVERYIQNELKHRKSDQQKFEMQLNWWKQHLGDYYLSSVTPALIAECRDSLQKEPIKYILQEEGQTLKPVFRSNATVNRYMASLSIAMTIATNEWLWLEENPMRKVKKRTEPRGRVRFLSKDEQATLLHACQNVDCPCLYVVVVLALATGGRYSEILNLKWQDVNFDKNIIIFMDTKNGEHRPVPLSNHPKKILLEYSKTKQLNSDYVFPRKDGKAPLDLRKKWDKALENSGIADFNFHDLRHTAASNLAKAGASLMELSHILGHKTLQMVKRYAHLTTQHTAKILEKMNKEQFKASVKPK